MFCRKHVSIFEKIYWFGISSKTVLLPCDIVAPCAVQSLPARASISFRPAPRLYVSISGPDLKECWGGLHS